jgi:hypothetical protein
MLLATGTAQASESWCPTGSTTSWTGGSGVWAQGAWSDSQPTSGCNAVISGNVTVTLITSPDPDGGYTDSGGSALGLTVTGGATLVIEGEGSASLGNWNNSIVLGLGDNGLTIGPNSKVVLDATGGDAQTANPGDGPGGSAQIIATNSQAAPFVNQGTIVAEQNGTTYGTVMNFGGPMTNSGALDVNSGTFTFSGASPYMTVNNTGTVDVASGASLVMHAGDGSSFTNSGSYVNDGSSSVGGTMHYNASGGSESGNPIQFQYYSGAPTLVDSSTGGAGSYLFDAAGGHLEGTIPAGQTVGLQGFTYNCSGNQCNDTSVDLDQKTLTNDGTLTLDAPGSGTTTGGISTIGDGTIANYGKVVSTVEDSNYHNEMQAALQNQTGGTVDVASGMLEQTGGTSLNSGLWQVAPGATYELYGGSFTNNANGTLQPQIAGSGSFGAFIPKSGTFTAAGTLAPALASGYVPAAGSEFQIFPFQGGTFTGTFASTTGGFTADYKHETVTTGSPYVGVVYGAAASTAPPKPSAKKLTGGAALIKATLACAKGAKSCAKYTVTATVTEHLKGSKITAISARAGEKKATKAKTKVVKVASGSGTLASGKSKTLKLNSAGKALLKRFGKLKVKVAVTAGGKTVKTATVSVTKPKAKKKKK